MSDAPGTPARPKIAVIGCGNPTRSDDGAGIEVLRLLNAAGTFSDHPEIRLFDAGTDGMAVMFAARGCETLVIVDACRTGGPPGDIFVVPGETLAAAPKPGFNLHELRWDHALHAGRAMYGAAFPTDVSVFLIEADSVAFGIGLSEAVQAAAASVAERITALVRARLSIIHIKRGTLHLDHGIYERFFNGLAAVVLLREGHDLVILPVRHAAAGGYLLKLRNRAGDRVVDAADFFRSNGVEDHVELSRPTTWSEERAGLIALRVFT